MFNDEVTIYHFENEQAKILHFKQVYFEKNISTNQNTKGAEKASFGTIIIPTTEKLNISTDDYVIEGIISDNFDLLELMNKYQVFKVIKIQDNRRGSLQHFEIGVDE